MPMLLLPSAAALLLSDVAAAALTVLPQSLLLLLLIISFHIAAPVPAALFRLLVFCYDCFIVYKEVLGILLIFLNRACP